MVKTAWSWILLLTDAFGDSTDRSGNVLVDDTMAPALYDSNDKKVSLANAPCAAQTPCVFVAERDKKRGPSHWPVRYRVLSAGKREKRRMATVTSLMSPLLAPRIEKLNGLIYQLEKIKAGKPYWQ